MTAGRSVATIPGVDDHELGALDAVAALRDTPSDVLAAVAALVWSRPAWHRDAACRGVSTRLFFPADPRSKSGKACYEVARRFCARCPVSAECAAAGARERAGMWGGESAVARARKRRRAA